MIPGRLRTGLAAASALAAGLVLRLWFVTHAGRIDGDTLIYGNIAKNWIQHGVYGFVATARGVSPTLIRLPGYPIFLAACFGIFGADHYIAVMVVQCIVDLLTCLLIAALAGRLFGRRAATAALWLSVLCPFTAAYTSAPLTEVLTLTTIALAFFSLERWQSAGTGFNRWLWIAASAMAYSVLLRPEQGLLPAAIVLAMLWMSLRKQPAEARREAAEARREAAEAYKQPAEARPTQPHTVVQAILPIALAVLCIVLPLFPWAVRNWRTFHVVQPLAPRYATDPGEHIPLGFQRWYRSWAIDYASTEEVYWNYDSAEIDPANLPTRAFDSREQYLRTYGLLSEYNDTYNATPAFDARFEAIARQRIHADPIRYYLALPVARLVNMLLRPRAEMFPIPLDWWHWRGHAVAALVALALAALNLAYFVLGAVGLWTWRRRGFGEHTALVGAMVAFVILRCALLLTLDNSEPRYTLEFFPLLIVWGSAIFQRQTLSLSSDPSTAE
jgi:hypothetical protein